MASALIAIPIPVRVSICQIGVGQLSYSLMRYAKT